MDVDFPPKPSMEVYGYRQVLHVNTTRLRKIWLEKVTLSCVYSQEYPSNYDLSPGILIISTSCITRWVDIGDFDDSLRLKLMMILLPKARLSRT